MSNRVASLQTRRTVYSTRHEMKINTIKLKAEFISRLKSKLTKNELKMPCFKNKFDNLKMNKICSPTTFRDIKQRMISPHIKCNEARSKRKIKNIMKLNPINNQKMFVDYTKDQIKLIDKISSRIEEARTIRNGFRSPRILSGALMKGNSILLSRNNCFLKVPDRQLIPDNYMNSQNNHDFTASRLRTKRNFFSL